MRVGSALCYTSFHFRGGLFTQISSELSPDAQAELGLNFDSAKMDAQTWAQLSGGLPLSEDSGNMCAIPLLGAKSGMYKVVTDAWPTVVELETVEGFIEMANEEGQYQLPEYGTPLRGRVAR